MSTRELAILGVVATLLSLYWGFISPSTCSSTMHLHECTGKPHHSSWGSWWHSQRNDSSVVSQDQDQDQDQDQNAGTTTKDWNILYHLGGNGPWVEKITDVVDTGIAVPPGCEVEQVHMLARHAERYPTKAAGRNQHAVVAKMKNSNTTFTGRLAFFNTWTLFWTSDTSLEHLTSTGPFSGRLSAFTTGVRLRTRYPHLVDRALASNATTLWASDSPRVIETARHFSLGLFGLENPSNLQIIPETPSRGSNTLTPGRTCLNNLRDTTHGKAKGYRMMHAFLSTYLPATAARLTSQTGVAFSTQDVFAMQEMCGFETTVRGRSEWCGVFTREEFLGFEYARDLLHYYRAGPGQRYARVMGGLWVNATAGLMEVGREGAGPLFLSFVHDGDIAPMLTALGILDDPANDPLPITHIAYTRKWRKSQVSPMGGRVILELLSCDVSVSGVEEHGNDSSPNSSHPLPNSSDDQTQIESQSETTTTNNNKQAKTQTQTSQRAKFIRVNINDGITALPDCASGPGQSCPLAQFLARTRRRGEAAGGFREVCGLSEEGREGGDGGVDGISFLRQWSGGDE